MKKVLIIIVLLLPLPLMCAGQRTIITPADRKEVIQELELMLTEHPTFKEELGILSTLHTQYKLYTESLELSLKKCEKKTFIKEQSK